MRVKGERQLTLADWLTVEEMSHVLSKDCRSTCRSLEKGRSAVFVSVCWVIFFSLWKSVFSLVLPGSDTELFPQWMDFTIYRRMSLFQSWKLRFLPFFLVAGTEWSSDGPFERVLFIEWEAYSTVIAIQLITDWIWPMSLFWFAGSKPYTQHPSNKLLSKSKIL